MNSHINEKINFSIDYKDQFVTFKLTKYLQTIIPNYYTSYIIACIGTDRSTGDSLGPLTGSLLKRYRLKNLHVYGTLHKPLHALNLEQFLSDVKSNYNKPYIIAIDAALGKLNSIGKLYCSTGPIQPGTALNKNLPEVGHAHISATVNINSELNYLILQNTRLSVVYDMANILANTLYRFDLLLSKDSNRSFAT